MNREQQAALPDILVVAGTVRMDNPAELGDIGVGIASAIRIYADEDRAANEIRAAAGNAADALPATGPDDWVVITASASATFAGDSARSIGESLIVHRVYVGNDVRDWARRFATHFDRYESPAKARIVREILRDVAPPPAVQDRPPADAAPPEAGPAENQEAIAPRALLMVEVDQVNGQGRPVGRRLITLWDLAPMADARVFAAI